MNQWKRFFIQALLWLTVWLILFVDQSYSFDYLVNNAVAYIFQLLLIGGLIFYGARVLLFEKKYLLFAMISVTSILLCAQISSNIGSSPNMMQQQEMNRFQRPPPNELQKSRPLDRPPVPGDGRQGPRMPPAKFFIHLLMLSISFMLAAFIEAFLYARKKEEEHLRSETQHVQTELKLLKTQINPHFLFNSLNNIYALSVLDSQKTQQSISYLSEMLRYVLYECERPQVFLQKEISYIENYIRLFALKSSKPYPIETTFDVEDGMAPIAPMLFIPFIENALKHSHIERSENSFIKIAVKSDSHQIEFSVENSVPAHEIQKDEVGGIGLENVRKRLSILYPDSHVLDIKESKKDFSIHLTIKIAADV